MSLIDYSSFGLAVAAQAQQRPPFTQQLMAMMPMFLFMMVILYFLILRPQQKKQKDHQSMLGSMQKGDKIITIGGIHGVLIGVKDDIAVIKISENTKIEINKSAVATVIKQ
jgi:preprotein translocase subunit YajC